MQAVICKLKIDMYHSNCPEPHFSSPSRGLPRLMSSSKDARCLTRLGCAYLVVVGVTVPAGHKGKRIPTKFKRGTKRNAVTALPLLAVQVRQLYSPQPPPSFPSLRLRLTDSFTSRNSPRLHHRLGLPRTPSALEASWDAVRGPDPWPRGGGAVCAGVRSRRGSCSDSPGVPRGMLYLKLPAGDLGFRPGPARRGSGGGGA